MTTSGTAAVATSESSEPTAKRPRRRATRGVSSPTAPAPAPAEPTAVEPVPVPEPVPTETEITPEVAPVAETAADVVAEEPVPAEIVLPEPAAAPADAPTHDVASLDDIVLPGEPVTEPEKTAPKRRSRKKVDSEPVAELDDESTPRRAQIGRAHV